jgi:PTH1 family peptidyl-tRNA hydrolase
MENIIYHLQSDQFPRIRLGIGTDENMRPAEKFVLKPFRTNDKPEAKTMVKRGADALENLLIRGINHTMNHYNS